MNKTLGPCSRIPLAAVAVLLQASAPAASAQPANVSAAGQPEPAKSGTALVATKNQPFVNSLGMNFVPVPIVGGPTDRQQLLFSVWDTRVQDYEVFARVTRREWPKAGFDQGPTHPALMVSFEDAEAFCAWLTERERKAGKLGANEEYRLPSDHEWSCAVGIGERELAEALPADKSGKLADAFPWGKQWPPPKGAGNYPGEEMRSAPAPGKTTSNAIIVGYIDGYEQTSAAGSFAANRFGLFDMGGNVWQWCEDWFDKDRKSRVLRGASWHTNDRNYLLSSSRYPDPPGTHSPHVGFRCVIGISGRWR